MAGPRPALVRRARRLLGYWRSEIRTLRQGLVALVISTVAGFVAGLTLAHITGTLADLPGLLILIPAAVGMKGTIFGAIGARLGTANAAGVLEINLEPGGVLRRNVDVAVLTTFSSSLWLALLARFAGALFGQPSISLWDLAVISIVGGAIGSVLVLTITIGLSALSYRLEWDLDSVSTPMVTALGDMTTLPSLFLATFLVRNEAVAVGVGIGAISWALGAATGLSGMPGPWTLIGATLLAGLLVTPLTVLAGYYLAIVTYRFGLDPDNQGVPIITSVMDLAGVAVILIVMTSSGVLHG